MTNKITVPSELIHRAIDAIEQVGYQDKFIDYTFVRAVKQELRDALDEPTRGIDHETMRARYTDPEALDLSSGTGSTLRVVVAEPAPPAGGEPEVFEPHGWAQTDGPRINAFTREFDIAEEWAMAGYGTVELLNREHVDDEIDRLRGDHQAHITRLQAEVEQWKQDSGERYESMLKLANGVAELKVELTKALEDASKWKLAHRLAMEDNFKLTKARECLKDIRQSCELSKLRDAQIDAILSNQPAPGDKGQCEPVAVGRVSYIGNGFVRVRLTGASPKLESLLYAEQPEPVARDGWAEKMLRLIDQCIPDKHKTPGYSIVAVVQDAFNEVQTPPVALVTPKRIKHRAENPAGRISYIKGWNACLDEVARLNSEPKP